MCIRNKKLEEAIDRYLKQIPEGDITETAQAAASVARAVTRAYGDDAETILRVAADLTQEGR